MERHGRQRDLTREVSQRTDALREANARLERLASLDALTGIANRREFNRRLVQVWHEHRRRAAMLSVLIGDIDAFKAYNDAYGHLEGDTALAAVAAAMAASGVPSEGTAPEAALGKRACIHVHAETGLLQQGQGWGVGRFSAQWP